ncbi:MAG TPA: hypothetical protein VIZ58_07165, partial [Thermoanaerobaculia bacterium]
GLASAWARAAAKKVVVSACDTPLVPAEFYRRALGFLPEFDAAAPQLEASEPLISAWVREPALAAAKKIVSERRGPHSLLPLLRTRLIPASEIVSWGLDPAHFASANTPQALERLLALAGSGGRAHSPAPKF